MRVLGAWFKVNPSKNVLSSRDFGCVEWMLSQAKFYLVVRPGESS